MTALTAVDVTVALDRAVVVRGVSATIGSGGWLALIGPNGAGKSTLIRAVAGLVPYAGTITLDAGPGAPGGAVDARAMKARERARVLAYVPQEPVLPPDLTVAQYVMLGRTPHLGYLAAPGRHDRERADAAMDRLDVARLARRRLARLSGGERQRAVLARALAGEPRVLLLDEPTSMLDVGHEQQVLELVDRLRTDTGLTVVSTLHNLTVAGQYADTLVLLDGGQVVAAGSPRAVLTRDLIESVYAARVSVVTDGDGRPVIAPRRPGGPRFLRILNGRGRGRLRARGSPVVGRAWPERTFPPSGQETPRRTRRRRDRGSSAA
jgi:iron complex transport system ATP-binding protein